LILGGSAHTNEKPQLLAHYHHTCLDIRSPRLDVPESHHLWSCCRSA
jgi:hypothetical protein